MNQSVFLQELVLKYELWKVLREILPYEFLSSKLQSDRKILFQRTRSFQLRCFSHMKIANVHIGTIHKNVKIALQFSYQFAIFISVCNSHFLVYLLIDIFDNSVKNSTLTQRPRFDAFY